MCAWADIQFVHFWVFGPSSTFQQFFFFHSEPLSTFCTSFFDFRRTTCKHTEFRFKENVRVFWENSEVESFFDYTVCNTHAHKLSDLWSWKNGKATSLENDRSVRKFSFKKREKCARMECEIDRINFINKSLNSINLISLGTWKVLVIKKGRENKISWQWS